MDKLTQRMVYDNVRYHAGWTPNEVEMVLYSDKVINYVVRKVKEGTKGVHPSGKSMRIPDSHIRDIIRDTQQNWIPPVGDMYSRHHHNDPVKVATYSGCGELWNATSDSVVVVDMELQDSYVKHIADAAVDAIVNALRMEFDVSNRDLDPWVQIYGEHNASGLRSHSVLKMKDRRIAPMTFNMNY
jgi:hypothetical protein